MDQPAILYEEVQAYNSQSGKKLLTIFNALILVVCIYLLFRNRISYRDIIFALLGIAIIINLIGFLFLRTKLIIQVRTDGIRARYSPFHSNFNFYKWEDIADIFIREYNPVKEYGGWGIRTGIGGEAYNVSGNMGLQLVFKNGRRLLIGTNDVERLKRIVDHIHKHLVKL